MTDITPAQQTSASERQEAARKALAKYDAVPKHLIATGYSEALADALRSLIAPPGVGESEEAIATRVIEQSLGRTENGSITDYSIALAAVREAIQAAHESWEPADRPSQEQMLTWLGIEHELDPAVGMVFIREQYIEKEVI